MPDLQLRSGVASKVFGLPAREPVVTTTTTPPPAKPIPAGEFDQVLRGSVERFEVIVKIDEFWRLDVALGDTPFDEADEQELNGWLRQWLTQAEVLVRTLDDHLRGGAEFPNERPFRLSLAEARGACTPDEMFFAGEGLWSLRDEAIMDFEAGKTVEVDDFGG